MDLPHALLTLVGLALVVNYFRWNRKIKKRQESRIDYVLEGEEFRVRGKWE